MSTKPPVEETIDHNSVSIGEYVKSRLDNQDNLLRVIADDVKETRKQATKTNGRVTALEKAEAARDALQKRAAEAVTDRRWWVMIAVSCSSVVLGGLVGYIAHTVGG